MNADDLNFSNEDISFINERYPMVDTENLQLPIMGLSTISSLDYLESTIKFDLEHKNFENTPSPLAALNRCKEIKEKIERYREIHNG